MRGIGESFFTVRSTIVTEIKRRNHKYRFLELREGYTVWATSRLLVEQVSFAPMLKGRQILLPSSRDLTWIVHVRQCLHRVHVGDQICGFGQLKLWIEMVKRAQQFNPHLGRIEYASVRHGERDSRDRLSMRGVVVGVLRNGKTRRREAHAGNIARSQICG